MPISAYSPIRDLNASIPPGNIIAKEFATQQIVNSIRQLMVDLAGQVVTVNYFDSVPQNQWEGIADGSDTTTDQSPYWQAFRDALAAIEAGGDIPHGVIPQCVIRTSTAPNFAINYLQLETQGMPRIIATAAVPGLKLDGTGLGAGGFGVRFMTIGKLIASTTTGGDGIFIKNVHQSEFLGLLNFGAVTNGIYIDGCVSTEFSLNCTSQPEAFLATPAIGLRITGPNAAGSTANCTFYTPKFEQMPIGIELDFALFNTFIGGVAEGCTNVGLALGADAKFNTFVGGDFEANTTFDTYCEGAYNSFHGVRSVESKFDLATCIGNSLFGGHWDDLTYGAATLRNDNYAVVITTLTDPTTGQNGNRYHNCINTAGGWIRDWTATTPAVISGSGALSSASCAMRHIVDGNTVQGIFSATISANGSGGQDIRVTLPFASSVLATASGKEVGNTLKDVSGYVAASSSTLIISFYDGTYPGANGNVITMPFAYQRA